MSFQKKHDTYHKSIHSVPIVFWVLSLSLLLYVLHLRNSPLPPKKSEDLSESMVLEITHNSRAKNRNNSRKIQTNGEKYVSSILAELIVGNPLEVAISLDKELIEYKQKKEEITHMQKNTDSEKILILTKMYSGFLGIKNQMGHPAASKMLDERLSYLRNEIIETVDFSSVSPK